MPVATRFLFILLLQVVSHLSVQSPLGKNHLQVIAMRGVDYKKLFDRGYRVLQYKSNVANDPRFGNYTASELIYFENDTCIKDITILPGNQMDSYVDSFNYQFKPAGHNSWIGPDSSYISVSIRDGLLDITAFSSAFYKKISEH